MIPRLRRTGSDLLLLGVFALSGASGLAYEMLWLRDFAFLLGSTVHTLSAVLAAYMAGLAAGSWAAGRIADRSDRPLLLYAGLEVVIAASALVLYAVFHAALLNLGAVSAGEAHALSGILARFALTFVCLFVPTAAMGATFPLLARHLASAERHRGLKVGALYAANTVGAAVGCVLTGFWLIRVLGTDVTTRLAGALNLTAAALAVAVHALRGGPSARHPGDLDHEAAPPEGSAARFLLAGMFASGATCMAYEILYARFLGYLVGNRVHASTVMLAVFLAGIALGSLLGGRLADRLRRETLWFSLLQLGVGLHATAVVLRFPELLGWLKNLEAAADLTDAWSLAQARALEAAVLLAPPAIAFGALFPLAIRGVAGAKGAAGRAASRVYTWNTLGCIAGSLGTGLVAVPLLDAWRALLLTALVSLALGYRVLAPDWRTAGWRRFASLGATVALVLAVLGVAAREPRYPFPREGMTLLMSRDEPAGMVCAYTDPQGFELFADSTELSFPIGPETSAALVQHLQAQIPLLLHPHPRRILVIGLGFGIASGAYADTDRVESVETVEYFAGVIKAAPLFMTYNHDVTRNPKSRLIAGDGRHYLARPPHPYDIITSNVTGPDLPGSASCYTREYFALARRALAPGGLFIVHAFGPDRPVIERTLGEVFPHVLGFRGYRQSVFLIASADPLAVDSRAFARHLDADPGLARQLAHSDIGSPKGLLAREIIGPAEFAALGHAPGVPVNTDARPILEYGLRADGRGLFTASISPPRRRVVDHAAVISAVGDLLLYHWPIQEVYADLRKKEHRDAEGIYRYPFESVRSELRGIVFGNLEGPMTTAPVTKFADKNEPFYFRQPPRFARALKLGRFDVVSVANNHIRDCGADGVLDTLRAVASAGIRPVGAGANLARARAPVLASSNGVLVAFLAYDLVNPKSVWAGKHRAGAAHADALGIRDDVRRALEDADAVVVSLHWGTEVVDEHDLKPPSADRVALAHAIIDAGAAAVFGSHAHAVERVERYRRGVIFYGLGNFVFGGAKKDFHPSSVIARVVLNRQGVVGYTLVPVDILPRRARFRPVPLTGAARDAFLAEVARR